MKKKDVLSVLLVIALAAVVFFLLSEIQGGTVSQQVSVGNDVSSVTAQVTEQTVSAAVQGTAQHVQQSDTNEAAAPEQSSGSMPQTVQEVIDKYTFLVDKFKKERPAYTKKEFQALPDEYRNFGGPVNFILGIASNYMVAEEDAQELVKSAGTEDILYDMPIWGTEKGCVLTDYDAVAWAKCEDMGDGTYKLSFSLKEEKNIEPTPSDTLVPVSAHGAVMQPMVFSELQAQVDDIVAGVPGVSVNGFDLFYRDGVFSCIYDPATDQVKSITHNIVIDISADFVIFSSGIKGSARLLNDMLIYNITW